MNKDNFITRFKSISGHSVSREVLENIEKNSKEIAAWSNDERLMAKVILEEKIEDWKSYNVLFTMGAFLVGPVITIFTKWFSSETALALAMGFVILLTVALVFLWIRGRHGLYKDIVLLKLIEEVELKEENKADKEVE